MEQNGYDYNKSVYVPRPNNQAGPIYNAPLPQAQMGTKSTDGYAVASLILGILSIVMVGLL